MFFAFDVQIRIENVAFRNDFERLTFKFPR